MLKLCKNVTTNVCTYMYICNMYITHAYEFLIMRMYVFMCLIFAYVHMYVDDLKGVLNTSQSVFNLLYVQEYKEIIIYTYCKNCYSTYNKKAWLKDK